MEPKVVAWIDPLAFVEGSGYRVSLVIKGRSGHFPTGTWPYHGGPDETAPWFWGPTLEDAQAAARQYNRDRGVSDEEAFKIVTASMFPGRRGPMRRLGPSEPRRKHSMSSQVRCALCAPLRCRKAR